MGAKQRREKEKEIRKNDIIEEAEKVFFTKGYDNATMDDVAKEVEFSKRTLYVYFNSKEQIYFEIMVRGYKLLIGMLKEDSQKRIACNAVEEIRRLSLTFYQFSKDYPQYFQAIMEYENGELDFQKGIPDRSREECYGLGEEILRYLTGALDKGIAEGSIRNDLNVIQTALVFWACMVGVFNTARKKEKYIRNYHGMMPEELISSAFQLVIRSIQAEKKGDFI